MNMNMVVFTTKNVIKDGHPIVRVYNDEDGSWQFFDAVSTNSNENVMLVSMAEILETDNSLREILDMKSSHFASRADKSEKWIIDEFTETEE